VLKESAVLLFYSVPTKTFNTATHQPNENGQNNESNISRSYFTTNGQSVYLGFEPIQGLVNRYYFLSVGCCLKIAVLFLWGALSDERKGLQFAVQSLNGPSRAEPVTILYCLIRDSPNLKGQVPVFISPRNRVAQLNLRAQGSLYVTSYDLQGHGAGILTRLHMGH
jgi:hypothetical protein